MKIALVYDRVNKWGGAERVLLAMKRLFPDAPLYTSVYNKKTAPWAGVFDVKTSFLQQFSWARNNHEYLAPLMPLAFESMNFDTYDLVVSVTSEAAKGILTKPHTKHICYCLTPTRYLWSGYDEYFSNDGIKFLASPAVSYLRAWDRIAAQRPDRFIAISKEVKQRIHRYYDKEAEVVYSPVTIERRQTADGRQQKNHNPLAISNTPYFLIVSRLVSYKRIDVAIKACNKLGLPLKIIGNGSEEAKLKSLAGRTIEFLGSLTDEKVEEYYKGSTALLFPGREDFGLTVIEAQRFGKPVIAYRSGGVLETVLEGKTGEFFSYQTVDALVGVLKMFNPGKYRPEDCQKQAEKFDFDTFKKQFIQAVEKVI